MIKPRCPARTAIRLVSVAVAAMMTVGAPARADDDLQKARKEIELARTYKLKMVGGSLHRFHDRVVAKSGDVEDKEVCGYEDLVKQYLAPIDPTVDRYLGTLRVDDRTPQRLYESAIDRLSASLRATPSEEVAEVLRDAVSEYLEAQTLIGNDVLIRAFESRFPSRRPDNGPADPTELLDLARERFRMALEALDLLGDYPRLLRSGGNSTGMTAPIPEVVDVKVKGIPIPRPLEMRLALGTVERSVRANVARGEKSFLDSARESGAEDQVGRRREEAKGQLKTAAQEGYLRLAVLGALHSDPTSFTRNGANEVGARLSGAESLFQMIRRGENPGGFVQEFVPGKPTAQILMDAALDVEKAVGEENAARGTVHAYDDSLAQLRREYDTQRETFRKPLEEMTGLVINVDGTVSDPVRGSLGFQISDPEERKRFMGFLRDSINDQLRRLVEQMVDEGRLSNDQVDLTAWPRLTGEPWRAIGTLGVQLTELRAANLGLMEQIELFKSYPRKIQIEQERVGRVAQATLEGYGEIGAKQISIGWANVASTSVSYPWGVSLHISPGSAISGYLQRDISNIQANMQVKVEGANSDAVIKNLLLEQARAFTGIRSAENKVLQAQAILNGMLARTQRLLQDWGESRQDAAEVYFNFPTFRLERDSAKRRADLSFDKARESCYFAAKALEYEWAEAFSNPVKTFPVGNISLNAKFRPFARIDSLFSARDAIELVDFLEALLNWHEKMSETRGGQGQEGFSHLISLRSDILGFDDTMKADDQSDDEIRTINATVWKNWLSQHTLKDPRGREVALWVQFATENVSNPARMFPNNEFNQKLIAIGVGLQGQNLGAPFPSAELVQGGVASIRAFPPKMDNIKRLSMSGLGPQTVFFRLGERAARAGAQPVSTVEPDLAIYGTYMKISPILIRPSEPAFRNPQNGAMVRRTDRLSVAADRWTLLIDKNADPANRDLRIANIDDVLFYFKYQFNRPPPELDGELQQMKGRLATLVRRPGG